MFVESFEHVRGKHVERIFAMKIILMCAIFGIITMSVLIPVQNTEIDMFTLSKENNKFQTASSNINDYYGASGVKDSVPILEQSVVEDIPVEQGRIIITEMRNIPEELPICMTPEVVADWWQIVWVKGGYQPIDGVGLFFNNKDNPEYINGYGIHYTYIGQLDPTNPLCCWAVYNMTFDTSCDNAWCFESSYYPEIAEESGLIPGKLIDLKLCTIWQGCQDLDQRFTVILVTQRVLQTPKSPIWDSNGAFRTESHFTLFIVINDDVLKKRN